MVKEMEWMEEFIYLNLSMLFKPNNLYLIMLHIWNEFFEKIERDLI